MLLLAPVLLMAQNADQELTSDISTIAFGSCSKQWMPNKQLWKEVNSSNPDLWIWLGDNIYADTEDMAKMNAQYDLQKSHPDYQTLLSKTKVIGIWDDHDFGVNDGGKEYPKKDSSKLALFRFLEVPEAHPARARSGAYQSYAFNSGAAKVKIILLDARYFRDPLSKDDKNWNIPNKTGEILGEEQWRWFEDQLLDESIDLFVIASGIQFIPEEHRFEKWANFPQERNRLFEIIPKIDKPVVLISGDRHISETSTMEIVDYPFPIYEFTSSSLNSPWGNKRAEPNQFRIEEIVYETNFTLMSIVQRNGNLTLSVKYLGKENEVYQSHIIDFGN